MAYRNLEPEKTEEVGIRGQWRDAQDAGSCNFCSRGSLTVFVASGDRHVEVRFCSRCLKHLKKATT